MFCAGIKLSDNLYYISQSDHSQCCIAQAKIDSAFSFPGYETLFRLLHIGPVQLMPARDIVTILQSRNRLTLPIKNHTMTVGIAQVDGMQGDPNVRSNGPMIQINTEMGFKPYLSNTIWQVDTADVEKYLEESRSL